MAAGSVPGVMSWRAQLAVVGAPTAKCTIPVCLVCKLLHLLQSTFLKRPTEIFVDFTVRNHDGYGVLSFGTWTVVSRLIVSILVGLAGLGTDKQWMNIVSICIYLFLYRVAS